MKSGSSGKIKKKIALMAIGVGVILSMIAIIFVQGVREQLWQQSVSTIMESTQQGCNTLKVQLRDEYESMNSVVGYVKEVPANQKEMLEDIIGDYGKVDSGISLYLADGSGYPSGIGLDEKVQEALVGGKENGIINPHISSVTGINVFDLYVKANLQDGTEGYLVKEYEISHIVDTFSLSFYNDSGFSYVIDDEGDVLIRPPHPNSNKTVKNLFDMLKESKNKSASLEKFSQSLKNSKRGWAVFDYQGEETVATDQNTDRPDLTSTTLLRLILDYADSVEEAVEIAQAYDLHDSAQTSYHYMVADASGRSAILEWVGETDRTDNDGGARELVVTYHDDDAYVGRIEGEADYQWITNFILQPGYYGPEEAPAGQDRYQRIYEELSRTGGVVADETAAMDILAAVGRRTWNNDDANSCTVHSVVYNLTDRTALWVPNEHYSEADAAFTFQFPDAE